MAAAPVDIVGSTPISFTRSNGTQIVVPLSALYFDGAHPQVRSEWATATVLDTADTTILCALAAARLVTGELTPASAPPPAPALAFVATHAGVQTNGITVTATTQPGQSPLTAEITVSVIETDTWSGLTDGAAAAMTIGVDVATGNPGDPPAGTGLIVVQHGSTGGSTKIPVASNGTLAAQGTEHLYDADSKIVCTIMPRTDYAGTSGLPYTVTPDATGPGFTISVVYDSTKETTAQSPITLQALQPLPPPVAYLVQVSAPAAGALLPSDQPVTLSGGAPGIPANGLLYT